MNEKHRYIRQLSEKQQKEIEKRLRYTLGFDYVGEELEEAIKDGMDSRLIDLEDVIDVDID